jgi:hypothetical protein
LLPVSLDCQFLIAPLVFCDVYIVCKKVEVVVFFTFNLQWFFSFQMVFEYIVGETVYSSAELDNIVVQDGPCNSQI